MEDGLKWDGSGMEVGWKWDGSDWRQERSDEGKEVLREVSVISGYMYACTHVTLLSPYVFDQRTQQTVLI